MEIFLILAFEYLCIPFILNLGKALHLIFRANNYAFALPILFFLSFLFLPELQGQVLVIILSPFINEVVRVLLPCCLHAFHVLGQVVVIVSEILLVFSEGTHSSEGLAWLVQVIIDLRVSFSDTTFHEHWFLGDKSSGVLIRQDAWKLRYTTLVLLNGFHYSHSLSQWGLSILISRTQSIIIDSI